MQASEPVWKQYGVESQMWLNETLLDRGRRLPPEYSLPVWYREKAPILRQEKVVTENSRLVSTYLLVLFEEEPSGWEVLQWLNTDKSDATLPFDVYLGNWKARCPPKHQRFVERIERLFGTIK